MYYFYVWLLFALIWIFWKVLKNPIAQLHDAVDEDICKVKKLLEEGVDPDISRNGGLTPLYTAIYCGNYEAAKLLIEHGADVNWGLNNERKDDFLLTAIGFNHLDIAVLLRENNAVLGIHYYSFAGDEERVEQLLRQEPNLISLERNGGKTPLHFAVIGKCTKLIDVLLDAGSDVNRSSVSVGTPLHQAIKNRSTEIVEYLLSRCSVSNENIDTGLVYAIEQKNVEIVKLLVEGGADINRCTYNVDPPIHLSVRYGSIDTTVFLLEKGVDVNQKNLFNGRTPLHEAAFRNNLLAADLLIHSGADVDAMSYFGSTPLGLSHCNIKLKKIEELLLQYGAKNYGMDD
jgi:ankyrin repeat protein